MSKIEELIEKLCPNGVEYKKLDEVCNFNRGTSMTSKNAIEGDVPVISGGQKPAFYHNASNRPAGTITIAGSGAYAGYVAFWDKPIFCADSFSVDVKDDKILHKKFLCYYLLNKQQDIYNKKTGAGIAHVHGKDIAKFKIPVPPLEVQCEIVHILDDFTLLSAELSAELKARQKQFSYYRECLVNNGGHKIRLDKIVDIYLGLTHTPKYVTSGIKFISAQNTSKDYLDLTNVKYISREEYESITQNAKPKKGDILFTRVGSNLGHPVIVDTDEELCMFVSLGYLRVKDTSKVSIDYIKHWINTENFWNQVRKNVHGSAKVNLNTGWLSKFEISIPNFDEQKKIVNILNVLEKLCNDISEGLPAEIEARQRQYELTFKELKVNE